MKKIKKKAIIILSVLLATVMVTASGCSFTSSSEKDPVSIIQDAYGNEQFRISFSSEGLAAPLEDVYYTASSIPKLPTPERVGYIFAGWYFDSALTQPYEDEYLLIMMKDITLYARWIEESMDANGTYAIEFDACVVDGSVTEGALTQIYGGYDDFSEAIVEDETYIEKTDDAVQLKLTYDTGVNVPFGATAVYTVAISGQSANNAYIAERITAETDTQKTVFINIDNFDITDTLYLSIQWINYKVDMDSSERAETTTTYTIAFKITRFIGFDRAYADTTRTLDDGYYLVRSYFRLVTNDETMMETFNPVYSYLYAEDGNYTLIKPFAAYPFTEITAAEGITQEQLYSRYTNYYKILAGYDAVIPDGDVGTDSSTENMIENWNLGYYREISYEFHADTGQCYYVIDMGDDYKSEIILQSTSTGMESSGFMGLTGKRLRIDYDYMIPLDDSAVDYTPLEGDSFVYSSTTHSYAFDASDLVQGDNMYSYMEEYGLFTNLINFYFSATGTVNADTQGGAVYSTKITLTPTGVAANMSVSDMRYNIAEFNVVSYIYGYDATEQNLCVDGMGVQNFSGATGRRTRTRLKVGKSVNIGDAVSLQLLYSEKVNPSFTDFGQVRWQAYKMDGDSVDFSSPVTVESTFTFEEDIAILFTLTSGGSTQTSLVELHAAQQPTVTVVDGTYDEDAVYTVGDSVTLPRITYSWYGKEESYIYNYFPDVTGYEPDVDVLTVGIYEVDENGIYTLIYRGADASTGKFTITAENMLIVYEMSNYYGEKAYYTFVFSSYSSPKYSLIDSDGNELLGDDLDYDNGEREVLELTAEDMTLGGQTALEAELSEVYKLVLPNEELAFSLQSYSVYTRDEIFTSTVTNYTASDLAAEIFEKIDGAEYAYLQLVYTTEQGDTYAKKYLCNVTFGGRANIDYLISFDDYFTNTQYVFTAPTVVSNGGIVISSGRLSVQYFNGSNYVALTSSSVSGVADVQTVGLSYVVTFNRAGSYRLVYTASMRYDENGDAVFSDRSSQSFVFYLYFEVLDYNTDMTITYVTDAEHPFSESIQPFATAIYNESGTIIGWSYTTSSFTLASGNPITLNSSVFASTTDGSVFYAWGTDWDTWYSESSKIYLAGNVIQDFIGAFNSRNVVLYALWDYGVEITVTDYTGSGISESTLYLQNGYTSTVEFLYTLDLSNYTAPSRSGYSHTGWRITDENGISTEYGTGDSVAITGNVTLTPVYSKLLTIVYNADNPETDIEESRMNISRSEGILEGSVLGDVLTSSKLQQLSSVTITNSEIVDTWEFKYWAVYIDGVLTEIDLNATAINGDCATESTSGSTTTFMFTLYAVYGPIGE